MSELRETRLEKGKALAALGQGPYALRFEPSHRTAELQAAHADLPNGEERRFLALELVAGSMIGVHGMIGKPIKKKPRRRRRS